MKGDGDAVKVVVGQHPDLEEQAAGGDEEAIAELARKVVDHTDGSYDVRAAKNSVRQLVADER